MPDKKPPECTVDLEKPESTKVETLDQSEFRERLLAAAQMEAFLDLSQQKLDNTQGNSTLAGSSLKSTDTLQLTTELPGYEILSELGRGGMGVVYRARQRGLNRIVALKMILSGVRASSSELARFRAEAEAVAKLKHPNIVDVYDVGEHDNCPFFSMEYVDGPSLSQFLRAGLLNHRVAAALLLQIAEGVQAAHQQGIVHRDLKPANILLSNQSDSKLLHGTILTMQPKITDFGLAKQLDNDSGLTQTGAVMGTPNYMSPEQANGETDKIGASSDIYSLGAILYEMLTGRPPFRGANIADTLDQVRRVEPVAPARLQNGIPRDLEVICLKCLQKLPSRRYTTASDLVTDLSRYLKGQAIVARPVSSLEHAWLWCQRNPAIATLLMLVFCVLSLGLIFSLRYAGQAKEAADLAKEESIRAEESSQRLRASLVRQHLILGQSALENKNITLGLWQYAKAWELEQDPVNEVDHRMRLGFTLDSLNQLVGICFHDHPVYDAKFHPSGKFILTLTNESKAYVWDPFASKQLYPPLAHTGVILASAISPDGEQIATGGANGDLQIWQAASGKLLHKIPIGSQINYLQYRQDSQLLAVATESGAVHFLTPKNPAEKPVHINCGAPAYYVEFNRLASLALTADAKDFARMWDVTTGKSLGKPLKHFDHRRQNEQSIQYRCWPRFSPDGLSIATVYPLNAIHVTSVLTGLATFKPILFESDLVHGVHWDPSDSSLYVSYGNTGHYYNGTTGKRIASFPSHPRESQHARLTPDGQSVVTCSTGGLVHFWKDQKQFGQPMRCADGIHSLEFSPDHKLILAASEDGTARIWRVSSGAELSPYRFDCGNSNRFLTVRDTNRIRHSPDGKLEIHVMDGDTTIKIYQRGSTENPISINHPEISTQVRCTPDGKMVCTVVGQNLIRHWDVQTGKQVGPSIQLKSALREANKEWGWSADGKRLLTMEEPDEDQSGLVLTVWDVLTGKILFGPLSKWDSGPHRYDYSNTVGTINLATISPDGTKLATASMSSGVIGLWDVDSKQEICKTAAFRGLLYQLAYSQDGKYLLTNSSDTVARLWNATTLLPAGPPMRHTTFCRVADLAPNNRMALTVASDNILRFWNPHTGELLGRVEEPQTNNNIWFRNDNRGVVVTRGRKKNFWINLYEGDRDSLPNLIRLMTGMSPDSDDGIEPIDFDLFKRQSELYRQTWLNTIHQ